MRNVRTLIAVIAVFLLVVPAALAQVKPQPAPVPNVEGRPLSDAQKALVSAGFNAVVTFQNVTDPGKNNVVLKQQIAPGTALAKGSSVSVVVGRYTAPAQQTVPSVVGMPLDKAQATLSQAKLNAAVTMQPVDQPQRNNVVLAQNVPAGKTLSPGSMVPIVVGKYTAPATVPVPNASGMKSDTARQMLEKQGWKVNIEERPVGDSRQAGMVLQQVPPPGTQVQQKNQPVTLHVGKAQEKVQVPKVAGMKLQEAQAVLAKARLNAEVSMQPVNDPQQNGMVIGQRVAPGMPVAPGSMVPIIVGKYTAPATVPVPNVTGTKIDQARQVLEKQGWKVEVVRMSQKDARQNNIVLQQAPIAGTQAVPQQTTVRLTIGYYAQPATGGQYRDNPQNTLNRPIEPDGIIVPDTVGKSLADARNTAQSRGWSPERIIVHERVVSDPKLAAGVVRSQKPGGGSSVPYKSPGPIELWVDIYKKQP